MCFLGLKNVFHQMYMSFGKIKRLWYKKSPALSSTTRGDTPACVSAASPVALLALGCMGAGPGGHEEEHRQERLILFHGVG